MVTAVVVSFISLSIFSPVTTSVDKFVVLSAKELAEMQAALILMTATATVDRRLGKRADEFLERDMFFLIYDNRVKILLMLLIMRMISNTII